MRIRTIKPEFFLHDGLWEAEQSESLPLRIAFIGLWCAADREGRFAWEPRRLGVAILPYDQCDFSRVLHALTTRGFIVKYRVNDRWFGVIPSFLRHQVINNRESDSTLPELSQATEVAKVIDASLTRDPRVTHAGKGEGKGREGKEGKEYLSANADAEAIFQAYPSQRRGGRKEAFKAIKAALREITPDTLLASVAAYAASDEVRDRFAKGEGSFIPLLATWLNKGRYTVEVAPVVDEFSHHPDYPPTPLRPGTKLVQLTANDI